MSPAKQHWFRQAAALLSLTALAVLPAAAVTGGASPAPPVTDPVITQAVPVVLLHGLARSAASMRTLEYSLQRAGYKVCNIGYPSKQHDIETLAREHVAPAVVACTGAADAPVHFVTHSMGGIVVRQLMATRAITGTQRVVMLAPPNHGSEVIDVLSGSRLFKAANIPAAAQLGTSAQSVPQQLGAADFAVGVIAGTRTLNPFLSLRIPGPDDGKVSVASARLDGAIDFLELPVSHVLIMLDGAAIRQALHFLEQGAFLHTAEESS